MKQIICARTVGALLTIAGFALILAGTNTSAHAQVYNVLYNFKTNGAGPVNPSVPGIIAQGHDGTLYSTAPDSDIDSLGTRSRSHPPEC